MILDWLHSASFDFQTFAQRQLQHLKTFDSKLNKIDRMLMVIIGLNVIADVELLGILFNAIGLTP